MCPRSEPTAEEHEGRTDDQVDRVEPREGVEHDHLDSDPADQDHPDHRGQRVRPRVADPGGNRECRQRHRYQQAECHSGEHQAVEWQPGVEVVAEAERARDQAERTAPCGDGVDPGEQCERGAAPCVR